jgi:hypothetical protein
MVLPWLQASSERVHLFDADERTLTFGAPSSVGCVRDLLVRGLVALANESGYQRYCGRSADGLRTVAGTRAAITREVRFTGTCARESRTLRFGCATAPVGWGRWSYPA